MVKKWTFVSHKFLGFFSSKIEKKKNNKIVFYVVAFDPIKI